MPSMDPREMHTRAQALYGDVLIKVTDDDLALPTPCTDWTVADVVAHVDGGNLRVAGYGGRDPIDLPDDRIRAHTVSSAEARAVFDADDGMTRQFELPFGAVPGSAFAAIRAGDLYAHAWDLATAIGADADLDRELGEAIHAATSPLLGDSLRGEGRPFGAQQPCPPDRPIADRMAAFLGRTVA